MFEQIREVILEYVNVPKDSITPNTKFMADIHMNSLDIMTMVGELEDAYDITIETEDLNTIFTIQDLIDYINERI
ncbi:MAG: acyl carrier protein [Clostridia bacterium]|nr:acyl carrier protein [Clostridia bacterium]